MYADGSGWSGNFWTIPGGIGDLPTSEADLWVVNIDKSSGFFRPGPAGVSDTQGILGLGFESLNCDTDHEGRPTRQCHPTFDDTVSADTKLPRQVGLYLCPTCNLSTNGSLGFTTVGGGYEFDDLYFTPPKPRAPFLYTPVKHESFWVANITNLCTICG